ncbi:16S rRNA (cytosine(967)-C(5))-methyltransferase RsmB [Chitinimonas sp. BJB300]|uniref:16S rRNA (cytosine(967)-C(5))-methyltransferase RsmB n=1 Tax=Chitinimonas sp. BJB300 TaxID=1559339 RepID=UPI000C0EDACB|nr:16S rRNA (cytosine(967)-C(5))-methyltransferase RsmB [Chitinimonas sp. BJB300]PHV11129.1 16S rRNA (cytosine(967)-C(5))-methyltransferase [Chitinimonas sp. BJB300]TSJ90983.1 16S rRNA (cytosine(967)-C(5))-methyltransferase RsmB [Chitinimonas sp. BJB300]
MLLSQRFASEAVAAVLAGRNLSDVLARQRQQNTTLEARQRSAIQDIAYTTLRHYGEIDFVLRQLLKRPDTDPAIRSLLATGIAQLAWGRAAPYAVVDHAVQVASQLNSGFAKGMVNAVLRNFLRQQDALMAMAGKDEKARWNHPAWWVAAMRRAYPQEWTAVLRANNQHPPMSLRVNSRKTSQDAYLAQLQAAGLEAIAVDSAGILLDKPVPVDQLPGFFEGLCSVQDLGAQYAAQLVDAAAGMRVLDACCAPGGKTSHLLELSDIYLTGLDVDATRLQRVQGNLDRLGLKANLKQGDASKPSEWWDNQPFDRILADVPCSASGVARRHPDIKWLRRPADFAQFAAQQAAMLDALWGCLKAGGTLLYATCSVFPQENQAHISEFLVRHPDARQLPLPSHLPASGQLLPNDRHDGFFYALLAKA